MFPFQDFLTPPPPTPTLPGGPAAQAVPVTPLPTVPTPVPTLPVPTATPVPGVPTATPIPGVPTAAPIPGTTPTASGSANLAAIVALFIYLGFFGALGYRRGTQRELWVLIVAVFLAFGLQQFSDLVVSFFDRFGKGIAFLTGQPIPEQSPLGAWATANTQTLLLLLWLGGVVLAYFLTNRVVRKSKQDGWSILVGILNGIVFAMIFAPLLTSLMYPGVSFQGPISQTPVLTFFSNLWDQISTLFTRFWTALGPAASNVFFLGIVLLVLFAAFTLRTSAKAKAK